MLPTQPARYLELGVQEVRRRAEMLFRQLDCCELCPRHCRVNRLRGPAGRCATGRLARVSSAFPHFGEEDCLRGTRGSGTVFLAGCNLGCVFCQNHEISQGGRGEELEPERLAEVMLELAQAGCHNINWVSPSHVVPQLLEALALAMEGGLVLPIVYNTGGYDRVETLKQLDGVVDVYLPDFKFMSQKSAQRYLSAPDYPEVARQALREMHRQVGPLELDQQGLARRGLLVRHLVMPGHEQDSGAIFDFMAELCPETYLNVMAQYHPDHLAARYPEIDRSPSDEELRSVLEQFRRAGLTRMDRRRHLLVRW